LVHYLDELNGGGITVVRNNQLKNIDWNAFQAIVISPGPGLPSEAGSLLKFFPEFIYYKKVLGVCLGMQAIVEFFGGELINLKNVVHGQKGLCDFVNFENDLFKNLESPLEVGRYHSWVANPIGLPVQLGVTAKIGAELMAIQHKELPIYGVQFHPESVLTPQGKKILKNWLDS